MAYPDDTRREMKSYTQFIEGKTNTTKKQESRNCKNANITQKGNIDQELWKREQ